MSNLFQPVFGVDPSTYVVSNAIGGFSLPGTTANVSIVSGNGVILKNGSVVDGTVRINSGDSFAIRVQSSPNSLEAYHTVIQVGDVQYTFTVVTVQEPSYVPYAPFANIDPYDLTTQRDGTPFVPDSSGNAVVEYNASGTVVTSVPVPQTSATTTSTNGVIVVPNYFSDSISFIDTTTQQVVATVPVGSKPYAITYSLSSSTDRTSMVWVTLSGEAKVALVSMATKQVVAKYDVGTLPMGITTSYDGRTVYVANRDSYSITKFTLSGSDWTSVTTTIDVYPVAIALDTTNVLWILGNDGSLVAKNSTTYAYVWGINRWMPGATTMAMDPLGLTLWIPIASGDKVRTFTISSRSYGDTFVGKKPRDVAFAPNGDVLVTNFGSSDITIFAGGRTTKPRTVKTGNYPYGIATDPNGNFWVADYYANTPSFFDPEDHTPDDFAFAPELNLNPGVEYTTELVQPTGLVYSTALSVPPIYEARIVWGSKEYAGSLVVDGSVKYQIRFKTPMVYSADFEIPVFLGDKYATIHGTTRGRGVFPDAVTFTTIKATGPHMYSESSTATISGLQGTQIWITTDRPDWRIRVNGVLSETALVLVKDGDVVSLVGYADLYDDTVTSYAVQIMAGGADASEAANIAQPFGSYSIVVPVVDAPCIEWDYTFHVSDTPSRYVEWDMVQHAALAPLGTKALAGTIGFIAKPSATREPVALHVAEVQRAFVTSESAKQVVGESQAKYVRDVLDVVAPAPRAQFEQMPHMHTEVVQRSEFVRDVRFNDVKPETAKYVRDVLFNDVTAEPAYARNPVLASREALAQYQKEVQPSVRKYGYAIGRNPVYGRNTVEPKYVKNTQIETTALPACERNTVMPVRTIEPKYVVLPQAIALSIEPVYVKFQDPAPASANPVYLVPILTRLKIAPSDLGKYITVAGTKQVPVATAQPVVNTKVVPRLVSQKFVRVEPTAYAVPAMQPLKTYTIHNLDYADTPEMQGTYATEAEAIAAGMAEGYSEVRASVLPGGTYMWNVPIKCDAVVTPPPTGSGIAKPEKWYVQGG